MSDNEDWHLEWDNYFDDLDHAIERMLVIAARAEKENLHELDYHLIMAASALELVAMKCKDFVNLRVIELTHRMYQELPMFRMLRQAEKKLNDDEIASTFSSLFDPDDSSPPD